MAISIALILTLAIVCGHSALAFDPSAPTGAQAMTSKLLAEVHAGLAGSAAASTDPSELARALIERARSEAAGLLSSPSAVSTQHSRRGVCTPDICGALGQSCPRNGTASVSCKASDLLYCTGSALVPGTCQPVTQLAAGAACSATTSGIPNGVSAEVCAQRPEGPITFCQAPAGNPAGPRSCRPVGYLWPGAQCSCDAQCSSGSCAAGQCAGTSIQPCGSCNLLTNWCDYNLNAPASSLCPPRVADGQVCTNLASCGITSLCDRGTCAALYSKTNGSPCNNSLACNSFFCDPVATTCQPAPAALDPNSLPTCSTILNCNYTFGESCSCLNGNQRCVKSTDWIPKAMARAMDTCRSQLVALTTCFDSNSATCLASGNLPGQCCCQTAVDYTRCLFPSYFAELQLVLGEIYSCALAEDFFIPSSNICSANQNWVCNSFPAVTAYSDANAVATTGADSAATSLAVSSASVLAAAAAVLL